MHISTLLLPLLVATTTLAQYPTTSPEELVALRYGSAQIDTDTDATTPGDGTSHAHAKRRPHYMGIYVCNQENWKGNCWYAPQRGNACQNWDNIRSMGPDKDVNCDLFEGENCRGKMAIKFLSYPGVAKTPRNGLKSYRCGSY